MVLFTTNVQVVVMEAMNFQEAEVCCAHMILGSLQVLHPFEKRDLYALQSNQATQRMLGVVLPGTLPQTFLRALRSLKRLT